MRSLNWLKGLGFARQKWNLVQPWRNPKVSQISSMGAPALSNPHVSTSTTREITISKLSKLMAYPERRTSILTNTYVNKLT